ncbi:hypothetical protein FN846DRAFT_1012747 [Sphaerosporella brunnea]|uniref:Uncharacterized protein n=1 Tax=Sphaerosporella brunnea TaxID=1250544 RepID=A0A5J5FAL3_9PEZI|nr:hypothetical protein FN846DRAFT_1012747 [Sphaerosporella brunnea]
MPEASRLPNEVHDNIYATSDPEARWGLIMSHFTYCQELGNAPSRRPTGTTTSPFRRQTESGLLSRLARSKCNLAATRFVLNILGERQPRPRIEDGSYHEKWYANELGRNYDLGVTGAAASPTGPSFCGNVLIPAQSRLRLELWRPCWQPRIAGCKVQLSPDRIHRGQQRGFCAPVGEFHPFGPLHTAAFYAQPETLSLLLERLGNDLTADGWCAGCGRKDCGPADGHNRVTAVNDLACGHFSPPHLLITPEGMQTNTAANISRCAQLLRAAGAYNLNWNTDKCLYAHQNWIIKKWSKYLDEDGKKQQLDIMTLHDYAHSGSVAGQPIQYAI